MEVILEATLGARCFGRRLRSPDGGFNAHRVKEALATVLGLPRKSSRAPMTSRTPSFCRALVWSNAHSHGSIEIADSQRIAKTLPAAFVALAAIHLGLKRLARA